jgi:hypothetical protein
MMANDSLSSVAFESAAKNYCTVLDIRKVEKLCPDKPLQDAQTSIEAFTRELTAILGLVEHQSNNGSL